MNDMKPQQKIAAALLLALLGAGGVFLLITSIQNTAKTPFSRQAAFLKATPDPVDFTDTDVDGLTDIEELRTYKTDVRNPDTDGDGYMDGEEVALGTQPSDAASYPAALPLKDLATDENMTATEEFVGTLLNDIAQNDRLYYTEATGTEEVELHASYTVDDIQALSTALAGNALAAPEFAHIRVIRDEDIITGRDASPDAVRAYIAAVDAILSDEALLRDAGTFYIAYERAVLSGYSLPSDARLLGEKTLLPALTAAEKRIRLVPAPPGWVDLHKEQVSLIASHRIAVAYLLESRDPLKQLYGLAMLKAIARDNDDWRARVLARFAGI